MLNLFQTIHLGYSSISQYILHEDTLGQEMLHLEQWAYRKQFLPEKGTFPNVQAWDKGTLHKENPYHHGSNATALK